MSLGPTAPRHLGGCAAAQPLSASFTLIRNFNTAAREGSPPCRRSGYWHREICADVALSHLLKITRFIAQLENESIVKSDRIKDIFDRVLRQTIFFSHRFKLFAVYILAHNLLSEFWV